MKHYFLFLFILFAFACKKTNTTIGPNKMPFEHSSFLYLAHGTDQSILRRKLLHLNLAKILKENTDVKIASGDEFNIINEPYLFDQNDKKIYENYQQTCAEIIVSFKNHQEIYFVPTGIAKDNAMAQLDLKAELGNNLLWGKDPGAFLTKGNIYYLVSSNITEMKNNDSNFYKTQFFLKDFKEESFKFKKNQKIILDFKLDYFLRQTEIVNRTNANVQKCTKDMNEAGVCGGCDYKIEVLNTNLVKTPWRQADFNLTVKINNKIYHHNLFETSIDNEHLVVVIDLKSMDVNENIELQILPFSVSNVSKVVFGYDYSSQCIGRANSSELDLTPILRSDLSLTILGRNLNLKI